MTKRRSRGEGGLYWDEPRQRWIATVYLGFTPSGKRRKTTASARTKTEAKARLREKLRDLDDGLAVTPHGYTVAEAVKDWLAYGLNGRDPSTLANRTSLANNHVIPELGARSLRSLTADDVDRWLAAKASDLSTDTLQRILSILRRSINRAQARDKVKRNVAMLCEVPKGTAGRPSKSMTLPEAEALLAAAEGAPLGAYIVVSLLTGARTEELRALTWDHIDLRGDPDAKPPVPPSIQVWRSVRTDGDTKTRKSRRTLELPQRCVAALYDHRAGQVDAKAEAGARWRESGHVFASAVGTALDAANVRRSFRAVVRSAGLVASEWTPRELRHSFVSLLSSAGVPIEDISRLVGHSSTTVTETVYRRELRPVLTKGATAMDSIFGAASSRDSREASHDGSLRVDPQLDPHRGSRPLRGRLPGIGDGL